MRPTLDRFMDWFVSARLRDAEVRGQARFWVASWLLAVPLQGVMLIAQGTARMWGQFGVTAMLTRAGFAVAIARTGVEAVAAARHGQWAAMLMDVMMPEMDGLEATRRIRQLGGLEGSVPIIALTASALPSELAECRAAGMNDLMAKPLSFNELTRVLRAGFIASRLAALTAATV